MRISDWSSDVCSSDLPEDHDAGDRCGERDGPHAETDAKHDGNRQPEAGAGRQPVHVSTGIDDYVGGEECDAGSARLDEIGRASCRDRVCQYVLVSVVAVALKTKKNKIATSILL